jgi:membrane protein involved in colicin uptake
MWKMHATLEQEGENLGRKQAEEVLRNKQIEIEKQTAGPNKSCNFEVKKVHYKNIFQTI